MTQLMQLDLLSLQGESQGATAEIKWIPIELLQPHPDNPRLIYREDIIDTIAQSITESGFNPCYALLVRPMGTEYQIISGHTRLKAAQKAGCKKLPCWVKDMDDDAAFMELVLANNQGELSPLEYGMHVLKYVESSEGGRGKKGGLSEYARMIGKSQDAMSLVKKAAIVFGKLPSQLGCLLDKATHLAAIYKAPEQYWQKLTELLIEKEWSVKETEAIVNAVREIDIPEHFHFWLDPEQAFRDTINEAQNSIPRGNSRTPRDIKNWVTCAQEQLHKLPSNEKVTLIVKDSEGNESAEEQEIDLKSQFLSKLPELNSNGKKPSIDGIKKLSDRLRKEVEKLNQKAKKWERERAEGEERERLEREEQERLRQLAEKYAPIGLCGDVREVLPTLYQDHLNTFDLVLTDPPYLLSNDGITARGNRQVSVNKNFSDSKNAISPEAWLPFCLQLLKPGGVLVFTCTEHLNISVSRLESQGFEFLERLFWVKRSAPPRLTPTGHRACIEEIWVCRKPGETHFFNYELLKENYWDGKQASNYLEFEQCSGNERCGWHDTQKPLKLWTYLLQAYCPEEGKILDPFSGSGTTAVAAKATQRKCFWVEQDKDFFDKANDRISASPWSWELS